MKLTSIIKHNAAMGRDTVHGAYTYRVEVGEVRYFSLSEAAKELAAHVTFDGVLYAACTACASVEPETRQKGVYVHCLGDEFGDGDCVFFNGAELPANEEEARALLEESADSTQECLDSIEFVR